MKTAWISQTGPTPFGPIWIAVSEDGLAAVQWEMSQPEFVQLLEHHGYKPVVYDAERSGQAVREVCEYLDGQRQVFELPIDWESMRPFQQKVLQATLAIPFGSLSTYAELARQVGKPGAARAVGRAEATNPMPLVIPCHRVLGSDGKLHGYGGPGGIGMKAWLLKLEGREGY